MGIVPLCVEEIMSGHSKWSTIKHKKGAADAKRGKVFSRLSKELMVAARAGGGDPVTNNILRTLISKAKVANMPNDNIDRAIKKGTGEIAGDTIEEIVYEGYASGGVGLIVKVLTDNRNRAAAQIRHIFTKNGSSFAQQGAVSRSFQRRGQFLIDASATDEETLMAVVLDAGAEDLQVNDEYFEVLTDPSVYDDVAEALEKAGIECIESNQTLLSDVMVPVSDLKQAKEIMRFIEDLENNDDVQDVYNNADFDDAVMAAMESESE
jgi:YebC/PmpR family DNA-binding regulatory protein